MWDIKFRNSNEAYVFSHVNKVSIDAIKFLFELAHVLHRAQMCDEFINDALLNSTSKSVTELNDSTDRGSQVISKFNNLVQKENEDCLEKIKQEFSGYFGTFYDKVEWFILSYRNTHWEIKERLFSELATFPTVFTFIKPWIEIAEGESFSWEKALQQSLDSLNSIEINVLKRTYI